MPETAPSHRERNARIALILLVIAVLFAAWRFGILAQFADPAHVKQTLVQLGPWGYFAFILAYAVLQPFGVPGTVFIMAAPLIWPWPIAYALSMSGTMAGSVVGFAFARFVARDWISPRIPARFQRYNDALEQRAFLTVVLLRFVLWMPPLLHAFFGVSKVRFWTHFWGSVVGYALPLLLVSYFGEKVFEILTSAPPSKLIAGALTLIAVTAGIWWLGRRSARRCEAEARG